MNSNSNANSILENLWLGSSQSVPSPEYDTIISVMSEKEAQSYDIRNHVGKRQWHMIPVEDREEEEICQHFRNAHKLIQAALAAGKSVLVHCAHGVSRSPTIVAAYLMLEKGMRRKEAIEWIAARRPIVSPNDGFMNQLKSLEVQQIVGR